MALIKCEECGQVVSDKAAACPHCGCPIEKEIEVSQSSPPIAADIQESHEIKSIVANSRMSWLGPIIGVLLLVGSLVFFFRDCHTKESSKEEELAALDTILEMVAPVIETHKNRLYYLEDCPTSYNGLDVNINRNTDGTLKSASVVKEGKPLNEFSLNGMMAGGIEVYFMDANFDGYVDIWVVGDPENMIESVLFLWEPSRFSFVEATYNGKRLFRGAPSFCPETRKIYLNSGSASTSRDERLSWNGHKLVPEEEFKQLFLTAGYEGDYLHRYNVKDCITGKIIVSTDDPREIPANWKHWTRILTESEEEYFAAWDNSLREQEGASGSSFSSTPSSSSMNANQNDTELDVIRAQLERERGVLSSHFEDFKLLMQKYGTSSPDPYVYENLMQSLNRMIALADKGEKLARQMGDNNSAKWFKSQAQECRNGKNQLIYQH